MFNPTQIKFIKLVIENILITDCTFDVYLENQIVSTLEKTLKSDEISLRFIHHNEEEKFFINEMNFYKQLHKKIGTYLKGLNMYVYIQHSLPDYDETIIRIKKERERFNHKKSEFIYHITKKTNVKNILKKGLIVNHNINNFDYNKTSYLAAIKGIWFFGDIKYLPEYMFENFNLRTYCILKIKVKDLKNKFYYDCNQDFTRSIQIKTYEPIPSKNIEVLNKSEIDSIKKK